MGYNYKGHYGHYSGNAKHSKHHMVNSWEEEDVARGRKEMAEGHKGHAVFSPRARFHVEVQVNTY